MRRLKYLLAVIPMLFIFSCNDIEGLNDYNAVFSFEITEHKGAEGEIEIGEVRVSGSTIHIPVLHGIHNFPLYFKGTPKFENPIDRVVGIDFDDWVMIDLKRGGESGKEPLLDDQGNYIFEEPAFYVQALSGLPREYKFKIDYMATSSDADVFPSVSFADLPAGVVIADLLTVQDSDVPEEGDIVRINVVNPTFPFSVKPTFSVSDGAVLVGNGITVYKFDDATALHSFKVVARDGSVKNWNLGINVMPVVNANSEGVDLASLELTSLSGFVAEPGSRNFLIEEYTFSASVEAAGEPFAGSVKKRIAATTEQPKAHSGKPGRVASKPVAARAKSARSSGAYQPADTLTLYINTFSGNPFPVTVGLELPVYETVSLYGAIESMVFNTINSTNEFYLLDTGNDIARRWVVALAEYNTPVASVLSFSYNYTASEVSVTTISGPKVPAIVMDEGRTAEIDPVNRCIYLKAVEINKPKYPSLHPWTLDMTVDIKVSNGASLVGLSDFSWSGADSWKTPKTFGVKAPDGEIYEWRIVIRDWSNGEPAASGECKLYGVAIKEVRPYTVELDPLEPLVIDQEEHTVTFNLSKDENGYPLSVAVNYTLSDFARIATQNNGRDPLVFSNPTAENVVEVVSENGENKQTWIFKLRPPLKEIGTDVTSFKIVSFSDSRFGGELVDIDKERAEIRINFTQVGAFPVTMNIRMGLSYKATSTITDASGAGKVEYSRVEDKTFTVTAQNGETRQWRIVANYLPQLQNAGMELWANYKTPLPKGVEGSPYWATANMESPVQVIGTTRTEGAPGNGNAAQLKTTNTIIGKLASGSLFLGWFDDSNPMGNMNDPTVMAFQGIPFASSRQIKEFQADVYYHPGNGAASDAGSMAIQLIKQRDLSKELVYHGMRPNGDWHPKNNADMVANGRAVIALQSGVLDNGDTATNVVKDGVWQTVFVPLEYSGAYPDYTHLCIICASSSQGDAFKGAEGSILKIDNIRLIYEE